MTLEALPLRVPEKYSDGREETSAARGIGPEVRINSDAR